MITTNRNVRFSYATQQNNPCDDSGAWDRLSAATEGATLADLAVRRVRIPFLVSYRGRCNREKLVMATATEVNGHMIKLIVREPIDPFQGVRIRPDVDGMKTAWVRGVVTDSIQSVGCWEIHVDCSGRRTG
jgi:hypothetical protein